MLSLFKYPGQTAPVKIGPVNAWVRPEKPAKREKGKGRRGERTRDGKIPVAREGRRERKNEEREGKGEREKRERGERKTFLLLPLLATEAISVARREEREDVAGEREEEKEEEMGERETGE